MVPWRPCSSFGSCGSAQCGGAAAVRVRRVRDDTRLGSCCSLRLCGGFLCLVVCFRSLQGLCMSGRAQLRVVGSDFRLWWRRGCVCRFSVCVCVCVFMYLYCLSLIEYYSLFNFRIFPTSCFVVFQDSWLKEEVVIHMWSWWWPRFSGFCVHFRDSELVQFVALLVVFACERSYSLCITWIWILWHVKCRVWNFKGSLGSDILHVGLGNGFSRIGILYYILFFLAILGSF